jgi:hypothetical protein
MSRVSGQPLPIPDRFLRRGLKSDSRKATPLRQRRGTLPVLAPVIRQVLATPTTHHRMAAAPQKADALAVDGLFRGVPKAVIGLSGPDLAETTHCGPVSARPPP